MPRENGGLPPNVSFHFWSLSATAVMRFSVCSAVQIVSSTGTTLLVVQSKYASFW